MDKPFFSVVIPTFNEEKYLSFILRSFANQTYQSFELIVVDGGSEDGTIRVFEKYKPLIKSSHLVISDRANVGYQRNLGAKKALGRYLVFIDADCNIETTFLEELHLQALKKKFPFATTWIKPDSRKPVDNLMTLLANLGLELAKEINKPYSGGYNTIIKKEFFEKLHGFREDLVINEDHDFAIRAGKKGIELAILKEPQVTYSLRRFRSQGTLPVLRKYAKGQIYNLLKGPITSALFDYPMGGHAHVTRRKKKINLTKLNTYLRAIRKLEKKILALLSE